MFNENETRSTKLLCRKLNSRITGLQKNSLKKGKYTSQKTVDTMGFSTINIHCNVISGVKDNGKNTDILYTFTLKEPPGYLINIIPTNILYQNVT